jgi:hypothetical protein
MAKHLYVYYKVPLAELPVVAAAAQDFQASLRRQCRHCAVRVRSEATETTEGLATVMEVYEGVYSNFSTACWATELPSSLSNLKRHEEWFEDVPDRV